MSSGFYGFNKFPCLIATLTDFSAVNIRVYHHMIHNKILWLEDNLMSSVIHSIAILVHKFPLSRCWIIQSTNYTYAVISGLNDFDRFLRLIATRTKFSATSIRLYHHMSYNKIPRFEDKLMSSHVHSIAMTFLPFF